MNSVSGTGNRVTMRVLYLGMQGDFSRIPLQRMLAANIHICGIVLPATGGSSGMRAPISRLQPVAYQGDLPLVNRHLDPGIVQLGWDAGIPVFQMAAAAAEAIEALAELRPDVAFVACYDRRLPKPVLDLPGHGFLNLHPSLLPHYRGPHPLFWSFRQGEPVVGVTLHVMDQGLDTGDIVLQTPLALRDGISGAEAEQLLAQAGAELIIQAIQLMVGGDLPRRPQVPSGSYYPAPGSADFELDRTWTARRAFNFMRGTAGWGRKYRLKIAGRRLALTHAASFDATAEQAAPLQMDPPYFRIQFNPGVLTAS
jgi:methionyl-tRNA formyltransferase